MSLYLSDKLPSDIEQAFQDRVVQMAANLGLSDPSAPDWLMAMMDLESAGTFSASETNSIGCVGLIQFCPDTPGGSTKTIGGQQVSLSDLASMTAVQQLDYVEAYLKDKVNQYGTPQEFVDLYLMIFLPAAIPFGDDQPIFVVSQNYMDSVKRENPAFVDSSGNITKSSIEAVYKRKYAGLFEEVAQAVQQAAVETVETVKQVVLPGTTDTTFLVVVGSVFMVIGGLLFFALHHNMVMAQTETA